MSAAAHDVEGAGSALVAPAGDSLRFLLPAKTRVPSRPRLVTRRHRRLVDGIVGWEGVVTVVAPAGFGKSALLAAWIAEEERDVAHVLLGEADGDVLRFVAYLAEALTPVMPAGALAWLHGALTSDVRRMAHVLVGLLLDALEEHEAGLLVVLDGIELLAPGSASWHVVRQLVDRRPERLCLALAGRTLPPFGLARARAAGRVLDLDEHALALGEADLTDLLADLVPTADERVRQVVARTSDGWPAPAVLAARVASERGLVDPEAIAAVLAVEGREFLVEEVVAEVEPDLADALGTLALLPLFDAELAACVLRHDEVIDLLDRLRHGGLVEVMDEGEAWRVWRPLVQALTDRGATRMDDPAVVSGMRDAGTLLAQRGNIAGAARLFGVAGAVDDLVELVAARWVEAFERGSLAAVDDWLRLVGDERVRGDARLLLVRADVAIARRDAATAEESLLALADAEPIAPTDGTGSLDAHVALVRAQVALRFHGDADTAVTQARAAAAHDWTSPLFRLAVDVVLASALVTAGEDEEGAAVVRRALRAEGGEGTISWALLRATAAILAGADPDAPPDLVARHAAEAWHAATLLGATEWTIGAAFRFANGYARLAEGELDAAEAEVRAGERLLARGLDRSTTMVAQHLAIHVAIAFGDMARARDRLEGAISRLGSWATPGADIERFGRLAVRLGLDEQDLPQALTDRELEVLRGLPRARTRAELAESLHVSLDTVKTHLGSAYRKLGVSNRDDAIVEGRRLGLL